MAGGTTIFICGTINADLCLSRHLSDAMTGWHRRYWRTSACNRSGPWCTARKTG